MKVVVSTDHHYDWMTLGVPRFAEIAAAVEHVVDEAIRMRAGLYIFGGDLAETEGPGMLRGLEHAVKMAGRLNAAGIPSLWLTGNHDVIEDGLRTSNLTPLRDVPGATLVDAPCFEVVGQRSEPMPGLVRIACLPFTPRSHGYSPAEFVQEEMSKGPDPDLVVGHLMLEGIGPGSETKDMARGRDVFWPVKEIREAWPEAVMLGGHYHERQVFNGVHLPGSLCRLTRGEAANVPSYAVVDL